MYHAMNTTANPEKKITERSRNLIKVFSVCNNFIQQLIKSNYNLNVSFYWKIGE